MAFKGNIEKLTLNNNYYRKVLHTTDSMQLVVMSLQPLEQIGLEKHTKTTQFIRVEGGVALAKVGEKYYHLKDGDFIIIPPNTFHNIINSSNRYPLKLYTIYTPPEHPKNTRQKYKTD